jgi:hypothetical protein
VVIIMNKNSSKYWWGCRETRTHTLFVGMEINKTILIHAMEFYSELSQWISPL